MTARRPVRVGRVRLLVRLSVWSSRLPARQRPRRALLLAARVGRVRLLVPPPRLLVSFSRLQV
ncbi:hypothetical protein [Mycobacterium sp. IS-1742]|uniref:hypothetical protein n=1 Tax=Mycobacterium sp. IS-1742 TaxID=1772285 RepID=UPI001E624B4B|nr:hypothetical protein [Mycobacterium sp. IS-1742]